MTHRGEEALPGSGWDLYFNFARIILAETISPAVEISHVNGDFYRLSPGPEFGALQPGEQRKIAFDARVPVINEFAAPAGFYFVFSDGMIQTVEALRIAPFVDSAQTNRGSADQLPVQTPQLGYEQNERLTLLPPEELYPMIPTPVRFERGTGSIQLDSSFRIHCEGALSNEAEYLADELARLLGSRPPVTLESGCGPRIICLRIGPVKPNGPALQTSGEAYRLITSEANGIEIVGSDRPGVFYGIQGLRALVPPREPRLAGREVFLPEVFIEDAPRFAYRGMHLDVARNFQSREAVKKLLSLMAFYKLNRFHFHLTDDEGWRLAIPELPELTQIGSRRGHTLDERDRLVPSYGSGPGSDPAASSGSGFYSREEFIEILRHAKERHIEVIPEIDVPGHARAAIRAMDARYARLRAEGKETEAGEYLLRDLEDRSEYRSVQGWTDNVINVCEESAYRFLETIFEEVAEMYREADAPLTAIHIGGDEVPEGVWERSPACRELIEAPGNDVDDHKVLPGYFLTRVSGILAERGLVTAGWEEIALTAGPQGAGKVPNPAFQGADFRAYAWNSVWGWGGEENAYKLANAGYQVILSNASNLYLDLAYNKHPKEPGQHWAGFVDTRKAWEFIPLNLYLCAEENLMGRPLDPGAYSRSTRLTAHGRGNILGIQGQLWSEHLQNAELVEYMAFPKLLGLAQRAWTQERWEQIADRRERERMQLVAWNRFANTLGQRELPRLATLYGGVRYRIPPPGAVVEDGQLKANVAFPGLTVRYTSDGSEPTADSPVIDKPVAVTGPVKLKTFDTRNRSSRTSVPDL